MTSYRLHARRGSARPQQRTDVARIAGQHHVRRGDQERYMGGDNIGRTSPPEQLTYPLAVVLAQWFDTDTCQHAREIGLLAAIAPDLTNNRRARPQRRALPLEHAQLGTYHTITTVNGDQGPGVEYRLHATSERGARPSRDAAASSSASVKGPSSDSHASKAAPSSSFLSLSAAASLSHVDTLVPCRAAAWRTPSPSSGGIVMENLSTCAMHTVISHTGVFTVYVSPLGPPAHRLAGSLEGMIIDPVYEGKSMAGLIDLVRTREIGKESNVLYAHLGGQPALNAYSALFRY
jgi:hypothetical protein